MPWKSMCRTCIVEETKMFDLDKELRRLYEKLTNTKFTQDDVLPKKICYICYSQLQRCRKFSEIALKSEKMLRDWVDTDGRSRQIGSSKIMDLRVVENLSVTVSHAEGHSTCDLLENRHRNNYVCVTERPISVKIEVVDVESMKQESESDVKTERILVEDYGIGHFDTDAGETNRPASCASNSRCDSESSETQEKRRKTKPFSCRKCHKGFFMSRNLIDHMKDCFAVEDLTCATCNTTFSNIGKLKKHMMKHSSERPFVCDRCSSKFKTRAYLKAHMKIHSGEKKYACEVCGKAFALITNFKTHMMIHEGTKKFACDVCDKAFHTNGNLKSHMRCHTGERPFQCNTCGLTFGFKCSLKQHIRRLHTEVKPFQCSQCHLSFNQEVALTSHMRGHTAERSYRCDKCNKTFTSARNLKGHMDVHSEERPYSCTKCGKAFKRSVHLKQHFRSLKCQSVMVTQTELNINS